MKIRRIVSHPTLDVILDQTEEVDSNKFFVPGDKIRAGFESGEVTKVTFDFEDGGVIYFERIDDELPANGKLSDATKQGR